MRIQPRLPQSAGGRGRSFRDDRRVVETSFTGIGAGSLGVTYRRSLVRVKQPGNATAATAEAGPWRTPKAGTVERNFNIFKRWRALATCYDRLALTYREGDVLRAVTIWLAASGDTT